MKEIVLFCGMCLSSRSCLDTNFFSIKHNSRAAHYNRTMRFTDEIMVSLDGTTNSGLYRSESCISVDCLPEKDHSQSIEVAPRSEGSSISRDDEEPLPSKTPLVKFDESQNIYYDNTETKDLPTLWYSKRDFANFKAQVRQLLHQQSDEECHLPLLVLYQASRINGKQGAEDMFTNISKQEMDALKTLFLYLGEDFIGLELYASRKILAKQQQRPGMGVLQHPATGPEQKTPQHSRPDFYTR